MSDILKQIDSLFLDEAVAKIGREGIDVGQQQPKNQGRFTGAGIMIETEAGSGDFINWEMPSMEDQITNRNFTWCRCDTNQITINHPHNITTGEIIRF